MHRLSREGNRPDLEASLQEQVQVGETEPLAFANIDELAESSPTRYGTDVTQNAHYANPYWLRTAALDFVGRWRLYVCQE